MLGACQIQRAPTRWLFSGDGKLHPSVMPTGLTQDRPNCLIPFRARYQLLHPDIGYTVVFVDCRKLLLLHNSEVHNISQNKEPDSSQLCYASQDFVTSAKRRVTVPTCGLQFPVFFISKKHNLYCILSQRNAILFFPP